MPSAHQALIDSLRMLPQRELLEVITLALESRVTEVCQPNIEEAKLCLAETYRINDILSGDTSWDLLLLARPQEIGDFVTDTHGPTQEGTCCGFTIASYAKRVICPICGNPASCT